MKRKPVFIDKEPPNNGWEVGDRVQFMIEKEVQSGELVKKFFHSALVTIEVNKKNRQLLFQSNGKTVISYAQLERI